MSFNFNPKGGYNVIAKATAGTIPTYGFTASTPLQLANGSPPLSYKILPKDSVECVNAKLLQNSHLYDAFNLETTGLELATQAFLLNKQIQTGTQNIKKHCAPIGYKL
jgi:hypothetical protein